MGQYATDGLKELAEWGNTHKMEQEMKEHVSLQCPCPTYGHPNLLSLGWRRPKWGEKCPTLGLFV